MKDFLTNNFTDKPKGIIVTFPAQFFYDLGLHKLYSKDVQTWKEKIDNVNVILKNKKRCILAGYKEFLLQVNSIQQNPDTDYWLHSMGSKPTIDVHWCYIVTLGRIIYKAKILGWEKGGEKQFSDGRKKFAKHWLLLNEFERIPDFKKAGFQGFRYVKPGSELDKR